MEIYRGQGENRTSVTVYDHGISADTNPPEKPFDSTTLPPASVKNPDQRIEEKAKKDEFLG